MNTLTDIENVMAFGKKIVISSITNINQLLLVIETFKYMVIEYIGTDPIESYNRFYLIYPKILSIFAAFKDSEDENKCKIYEMIQSLSLDVNKRSPKNHRRSAINPNTTKSLLSVKRRNALDPTTMDLQWVPIKRSKSED